MRGSLLQNPDIVTSRRERAVWNASHVCPNEINSGAHGRDRSGILRLSMAIGTGDDRDDDKELRQEKPRCANCSRERAYE